ncbi:hypothetical protein [Nocardia stercoris]|uniref:hypothetical protein n=1 Tax=Nocardia stercoris TaxID=2483361 RepID=UPI0011C489B9|nr:hypothetical protein [Nocardia stercoris]
MADDLWVDRPGLEGLITAFNTSRDALGGIETQSQSNPEPGYPLGRIEDALPGSGLGAAFSKAGWRANASMGGVGVQLTEIADAAGISINEYFHVDGLTAEQLRAAEGSIR